MAENLVISLKSVNQLFWQPGLAMANINGLALAVWRGSNMAGINNLAESQRG
jgi:hypothetical protein